MGTAMTRSVDVLVVGAGPTGLTLAADLRRRGIDVELVERLAGPDIRSKGKGLQPRSIEVFDDLGVAQPAVAAGRSDHRLRLYAGGKLAADLDLPARPPQPDVPYPNLVVLPQWRTEQVLRDRLVAWGGAVRFGRRLVGLKLDGDGVMASIVDSSGTLERVRAAYVVGTDGGRSTVRRLAGIALRGDRHTEHFILGDVRIDGLPQDGSSFAWFDGDRYLAADPLSGDGVWQVQATSAEEVSLELFQRLFAERGFPHVRLHDPTWLTNFSPNVALVDRYRAGRILLAGDAAHVHSPAGGQGMNTGVQDAYNLGWKLAAVVRGNASDRLLDTYEEERMPIARAVLAGSDLGHNAIFSSNPVMTFVRDHVLVPVLRLPAVQSAILDRTAELDVNYRGGSLSGEWAAGGFGSAGERPGVADRVRFARGPRAGDRAPDAAGLFDLFRGPHFTLLLFDGPAATGEGYRRLAATADQVRAALGPDVRVHLVVPGGRRPPRGFDVFTDADGGAHRRYGAAAESLYLIRPDGYVAFRSQPAEAAPVLQHIAAMLGRPTTATRTDRPADRMVRS
jgi:2-polyprenyl-6-methoxyphenol hydroxylase-like FAD-dependent oxidoreductase